MSTLAILGCSQLLTLRGPPRPRVGAELRDLGIIPGGAILARDGRIVSAGLRAAIEPNLPPDCEVIDAGGRILAPGFVDAHTHPVFAGDRVEEFALRCTGVTYEQIAASGGGILATVRKTRAASEDDLLRQASRHAQWFLRCGTTTIEAKSGYGLTLEDELKILRLVHRLESAAGLRCVPTFLGAHEVPEEYRGRRAEYVRLVIHEMLPRVAAERLAEYCDVFSEPSVFPIEDSRAILQAAARLGFGLRIHADQLSSSRAAELAAELRAATADHLELTEPSAFDKLAAARVQPVLLPGSVYARGSRHYPAARAMIDAGLAIVLATDFNPGSSPTPSMAAILSLACTQMGMDPAEAITAATINAAWSLGRGHELGSLEAGKRADFVLHDASDYRELAYYFGIEHAQAVYIGGRPAYQR